MLHYVSMTDRLNLINIMKNICLKWSKKNIATSIHRTGLSGEVHPSPWKTCCHNFRMLCVVFMKFWDSTPNFHRHMEISINRDMPFKITSVHAQMIHCESQSDFTGQIFWTERTAFPYISLQIWNKAKTFPLQLNGDIISHFHWHQMHNYHVTKLMTPPVMIIGKVTF